MPVARADPSRDDVIGTGPTGQTVIRRARAAGLIVAQVEGARAGPVDARRWWLAGTGR
jgi:hypothetical protein